MMKNKKIIGVVVTYNRKDDLINCLQSIFEQSKKVDELYIIDNNSTDGTPDFLVEKQIVKSLPPLNSNKDEIYSENKTLKKGGEVILHYVRKYKNDGGAGGFYKGMKLAYEANCDWLWLMDDDGMADKDQLKNLVDYSEKYRLHYVNALVIDKDNKEKLAFGLKGYESINEIEEDETIEGFVNPFNGTLISKKIINEIGLIKREMFIWGDEREYTNRVRKNGFKLITLLSAKHFHPKDKGITNTVFPFSKNLKVVIKPPHLEHVYYRNLGYLEQTYGNFKIKIFTQLTYVTYFLIRLKFKSAYKFCIYYNKGVNNNFS